MKLISKVKKILWGAFGVSGLLVMAHCTESKKALEIDVRSDQAKIASETDGSRHQAKIASETDGSRDQAKTGEDSGVSLGKTCEASPGDYCSPDSTEPLICPAGSYCLGEGLSEATPCPAGTFNPGEGGVSVDSCKTCGAGKTTDQEGQTSEDSCKTTTFQIKISGD